MADEPKQLVVDASVFVDLLAGTELADAARAALRGVVLHAPAHLDAEVLSALGRLERADRLDATQGTRGVQALSEAPVTRHLLHELVPDAWRRRTALRLSDALYVALAERLSLPLLTSDARLARGHAGAVDLASFEGRK